MELPLTIELHYKLEESILAFILMSACKSYYVDPHCFCHHIDVLAIKILCIVDNQINSRISVILLAATLFTNDQKYNLYMPAMFLSILIVPFNGGHTKYIRVFGCDF